MGKTAYNLNIFRVIAFNAHGESQAMSLQAFTTQPPLGTAKEPSQVGALLMMLVLLILMLGMLIMITTMQCQGAKSMISSSSNCCFNIAILKFAISDIHNS